MTSRMLSMPVTKRRRRSKPRPDPACFKVPKRYRSAYQLMAEGSCSGTATDEACCGQNRAGHKLVASLLRSSTMALHKLVGPWQGLQQANHRQWHGAVVQSKSAACAEEQGGAR